MSLSFVMLKGGIWQVSCGGFLATANIHSMYGNGSFSALDGQIRRVTALNESYANDDRDFTAAHCTIAFYRERGFLTVAAVFTES